MPDANSVTAPRTADDLILPRFVPDRIVIRDGEARLRGVVVLMGRIETECTVEEWVAALDAVVTGGISIGFAPTAPSGWRGETTDWHSAHIMADRSPETRSKIANLWPALMNPPVMGLSLRVQSVISAYANTPVIKAYNDGLELMRFGSGVGDPHAAFRLRAGVGARAATGDGPVRVANAGSSLLASNLTLLCKKRLLQDFDRADTDHAVRLGALAGATSDNWLGVTSLFQDASADGAVQATASDSSNGRIFAQLGLRGVLASVQAAAGEYLEQQRKAPSVPFDRKPLMPYPDTALSPALKSAIIQARADNERVAYKAYGERPPAAISFTDTASDVAKAVASHMMALRPDLPPSKVRRVMLPDTGTAMSNVEVAAILLRLGQAQQRRIAGIMAYPALARALHMMIDVELPIASLPTCVMAGEYARFLAAVAFDRGAVPPADRAPATRGASMWTACQRVGARLTVVGATEPVRPTGDDSFERTEGILNFSQKVDGKSRYGAVTLDVTAKTEQVINEARSEAEQAQGSAAVDSDAGTGRSQSEGLTILDAQRAVAIQNEVSRRDEINAKLKANLAIVLHSEDLSAGLRFDVGVKPRRGNKSVEWRSLMLRDVNFDPVRAIDAGRIVSIDVETLVESAMRAAEPSAPQAFRARLNEASYKPASRIIATQPTEAGKAPTEAEIVANETIGQWEGSPLGAPCGTWPAPREDDQLPSDPAAQTHDDGTDLSLGIALSLPSNAPGRTPPRYELGREIWINARDSYVGGIGLSTADAVEIYGSRLGAELSLPRQGSKLVIDRHERIAAPTVASLFPDEPAGPGETQDHLVVRSGNALRFNSASDRRILFVPSVAQASAAIHPHPAEGPDDAPDYARALDLLAEIRQIDPPEGKRAGIVPIGGMPNVRIDPATGGLWVRHGRTTKPASEIPESERDDRKPHEAPPGGVFQVAEGTMTDMKRRQVHYYPDPATDAIVLQLWTPTGTLPLDGSSTRSVSVYDSNYRTAVPDGWPGARRGSAPCIYPFAMPVLVELVRDARGKGAELLEPEVGTIDEDGRFRPLKLAANPPDGSVTVKRVRIRLGAGMEASLKSWCRTSDRARSYMAALNLVVPTDVRYSITGTNVTGLDAASNKRLTDILETCPLPEQAEVTTLSLIHAVQRPSTPQIDPHTPAVVRRDLAVERWPAWVAEGDHANIANWPNLYENHAATSWLGGSMLIDRQVAAAITLDVRVHDVRDEPGKKINLVKGEPSFPWIGLESLSRPLAPPPGNVVPPEEPLEEVDLLREGNLTRDLALTGLGSSAYHVEITPRSVSRFVNYMPRNGDETEPFERVGNPYRMWIDATRRPDPMGVVEILPAFVWQTDGNGCTRRTMVRLSWRRPARGVVSASADSTSTGCWYSSGKGEKLGIVLAPDGLANAKGKAGRYMSQWGADPIRDNISEAARPGWKFGAERFHYDCDTLAQMLVKGLPMLLPGEDDGIEAKVLSAATLALRTVDVLTFAPNYNPEQDAWWVDVDIDAGTAAAPFVRLGLVRYQQHAKQAIEAADDKRLSLPHMVEFVLEPKRTVTVIAEPKLKHDDSWPVRVIVRGPAGVVRGGGDALPEATLAERLSRQTRPYFKLTVLRGDADGSGEQAVAEVTSENSPPPAGDILWETVVYLRARPTGSPHYIFVEERDLMLSANQVSPDLVLSGPRFMAKVPITKRRKPRPTH